MHPLQDAPRTEATDRAQALAQSLDYLTEQDLCALCSITPSPDISRE